LGIALLAGKSRVPHPAAGIMAFLTFTIKTPFINSKHEIRNSKQIQNSNFQMTKTSGVKETLLHLNKKMNVDI
jgi:hypothetical protein